MNETWMAELREQLERQKAELNERVSKIKADVGRGLEADSKERAAQLENQEVLDALGNEAVEELAKINAALLRMEDGSYGACQGCGEAIDRRRLAVRPYASKCMSCADGA